MVNKKVRAVLEARDDADPVRGRDARGARGGRHRGEGRRARSSRRSPGVPADAGRRAASSPTSRSGRSAPAAPPRPTTPRRCAARSAPSVRRARRAPTRPTRCGSSTAASVKPGNVAELMAEPEIDGALVGRRLPRPRRVRPDRPVPAPNRLTRRSLTSRQQPRVACRQQPVTGGAAGAANPSAIVEIGHPPWIRGGRTGALQPSGRTPVFAGRFLPGGSRVLRRVSAAEGGVLHLPTHLPGGPLRETNPEERQGARLAARSRPVCGRVRQR